jgi:hypothetical protein
MEPDPRHARPASQGPAPGRWWAVRIFGLLIVGVTLALYFVGPLGELPVVARRFFTGALVMVGVLVFVLGWLIPWLAES